MAPLAAPTVEYRLTWMDRKLLRSYRIATDEEQGQ